MKNPRKTIPADLETIIPLVIGAWRRLHKLSGPADKLQTREFRGVVEAIQQLQALSANGESLIGTDYFKNPNYLGAYLLYQWVLHYQEGLSLIGELPETPRRVLDICSGPAAFSLAALRHGAEEVIAVDQNVSALQLGAEICGRYGMSLAVRKWDCFKGRPPVEGTFDLIILGYSLEELFPTTKNDWEDAQRRFLDGLFRLLSPTGHLLLVESSLPESNKRILQLREAYVKDGVGVQAPCVWRGECPALKVKGAPCYAQRELAKPYLIKEIQRAASINLSSLKMSYLILRHPAAGWPTLPDRSLYRVISPPVDSFHGKRFYLCGTGDNGSTDPNDETGGKKQLGSRLEVYPPEARAFEHLRRGELISFANVLRKQNAIDIVEGSSVRVEAPCGKPLPLADEDT